MTREEYRLSVLDEVWDVLGDQSADNPIPLLITLDEYPELKDEDGRWLVHSYNSSHHTKLYYWMSGLQYPYIIIEDACFNEVSYTELRLMLMRSLYHKVYMVGLNKVNI